MKDKSVIIIQARLGSNRLPEKVLKKIGKYSVIEMIVKRLKKSEKISDIIVATSNTKKDKKLITFLKRKKIKVFAGSEANVLSRYYKVAKNFSADYIVRICGDCPFVDSKLMDKMISKIIINQLDYVSNINPPTYPDGLDIEVFSFKRLSEAFKLAKKKYDIEHVTPFIIRKSKKKFNFALKKNFSNFRLTLDEKVDLKVLNNVFEKLKYFLYFKTEDLLRLITKQKSIFQDNITIKRNIGSKLGTGQKLWRRAINIIPGGNMLLSKDLKCFCQKNGQHISQSPKVVMCGIWMEKNLLI